MNIILDLPSEELPIERVLDIQWTVGLDYFGFSIFLKDQPLTRREVFDLSMILSDFEPPWSWEQRRYYRKHVGEVSARMSLCLKTFGQGGSGGNLISCVSRIYKFQEASNRRRGAKRKALSYTILLLQHVRLRTMFLPYSQGWRRKLERLIGDGKVSCRSVKDYYYTKIGAHRCSSFRESWRDASRRIKLCQS